jgi:hypothetical protein
VYSRDGNCVQRLRLSPKLANKFIRKTISRVPAAPGSQPRDSHGIHPGAAATSDIRMGTGAFFTSRRPDF